MLNFFATWCGPCLIELPHLQHVWESHRGDERFQMVVISRGESREVVETFIEAHGYRFPVVADPESTIYAQFATEAIPRTFVIAANGEILHASTGFVEGDEKQLQQILDELLGDSQEKP